MLVYVLLLTIVVIRVTLDRILTFFAMEKNSVLLNDTDTEYAHAKNLEAHCLICNTILTLNVADVYDIFKTEIAVENDLPKLTVLEKIRQVLNRSSTDIMLHSKIICQRCFNLLVELHSTEIKFNVLRSEFIGKFDQTVVVYEQIDKSSPSEKCTSDEEKLLITEEGKVVDKHGVEKFQIAKAFSKKMKRKSLSNTLPGNKKYLCSVCGKSFRAFSHRMEHMLIHLGEKPWKCTECKKSFRTKSTLKVHCMKHTGERPFVCQLCGKSFVDKYYLDEHNRIHSGEKPFLCSFCKRPFIRKKDLAVHMKSHTGDKPFQCSSCPRAFAVKSRLDRHIRIHTGEKPHSCEICGKPFARRDLYKVHIRQHTGEKPFHCGYCSKTFTNHSNCLTHVRTHTGERVSHGCWVCGKNFDRRVKLEKHLEECHSRELKNMQHHSTPPAEVQVIQPVTQDVVHAVPQVMTGTTFPPESLAGLSVTELGGTLHAVPVGQLAQVAWSDGTPAGTSTTYVSLTPEAYINIIS